MSSRSAFDLEGRVVVVTGASRGLGLTFARTLAAAGAHLVVTSRRADALDTLCDELRGNARKVVPLALDLRDRASIARFAAETHAAFSHVDVLVNNAGCNVRKPALDVTWQDWDEVLETNLRGTFFVTQALGRHMIARGQGRVVNIGSLTALFGYQGLAPYAASRGGLRQLTATLAAEWGPHGVTVNCLAPGWFRTAQNAVLYEDPAFVDRLEARIPLGRPGRAEDLEGALLFLCSDASAYITGQTLFVDGGKSTGAMSALPGAPR